MIGRLPAALLLASLACAPAALVRAKPSASSAAPLQLGYQVRYSAGPPAALDVTIELLGGEFRPMLFSRGAEVDSVEAVLEGGETVSLDAATEVLPPPGTRALRYRFEIAAGSYDFRNGAGSGEARVVSGPSYLLRPKAVRPSDRASLKISGAEALLPWTPQDGVYALSGQDLVDSGFHVFNGKPCRREVKGGVIEGRWVGAEAPPQALCEWLSVAGAELLTVRSALPHRKLVVALIPVESSDPSPFGMVLWSKPPSVALLVGRGATPEAFQRDWVATHEFLHTAHPFIAPPTAWLSEGLATYLTDVARMRSGRFSEAAGWRELYEGFEAGAREAGGDSLDQVTGDVGPGRYLAVYWGGALVLLEADLAIRERSGGVRSLDDVLEALAGRPSVSVAGFGALVDETAGGAVWDDLLARHRAGPALKEMPRLMESVGVRRKGTAVQLFDGAQADLRRSISGTDGIAGR